MNEWTVVTVLAAMVALVTAIVSPLLKLNTSIGNLTSMVDSLSVKMGMVNEDMGRLTKRNSDTHERIFARLGEQERALAGHETRITVLEQGKGVKE